jgi:hypothetical protein
MQLNTLIRMVYNTSLECVVVKVKGAAWIDEVSGIWTLSLKSPSLSPK